MIHWCSGRECHNNYRRDLVIWLVYFIYSAVGFALCYIYVILNYCMAFAVFARVSLCLNSCYLYWVVLLAIQKLNQHCENGDRTLLPSGSKKRQQKNCATIQIK